MITKDYRCPHCGDISPYRIDSGGEFVTLLESLFLPPPVPEDEVERTCPKCGKTFKTGPPKKKR